jgi:hypothetical protein
MFHACSPQVVTRELVCRPGAGANHKAFGTTHDFLGVEGIKNHRRFVWKPIELFQAGFSSLNDVHIARGRAAGAARSKPICHFEA